METLQLRNALIRIRKEEFGFTMFDGNKSIQANESFVLILKMIAYGDSAKKIEDQLRTEYQIPPNKNLLQDIESVVKFFEKMGWM